MPAKSVAQQQAMAIAEHHPSKLFKRNRGLLKMSKHQLSKFSSTSHKGLPKRKRRNRGSFHRSKFSALRRLSRGTR
jgi:hypothetical protein